MLNEMAATLSAKSPITFDACLTVPSLDNESL